MQITRSIADYVVRTAYADFPAEAVTAAKRAVLDTVGVMIAGSTEPCARIAGAVIREEGGKPVATVVGQGFAAPSRGAALVNGTAAHALDYDDVTSPMHGHPSPPLIPVLLAVGEETGASGQALIEAYILGFEVQCKVGRGLGESHYPHGWHATATLGALGATVAAGKLYGLDATGLCMALGIATSLAGGTRQNFGSMTKPLHPGQAAQSGILAAQLALRGFTADAGILEAPIGFLNLFSSAGDATPDRVLERFGDPLELVTPGISVKKYPCGYKIHVALDAILALREQHRFSADEVEQIGVVLPRGETTPLIHPRPASGLEGKFSLPYCMAAAVLDGHVQLDTFSDRAVLRPEAQALLRRVEVSEAADAVLGDREPYADVSVRLRGGASLQKRLEGARGSAEQPLSREELVAKYRDCAVRVLGRQRSDEALELITNLERLPKTQDLTRALAGSGAGI